MKMDYVILAEEYYKFVGEKNEERFQQYLHSNVELQGPLGVAKGKKAVFAATRNFSNGINALKVRAAFGNGNQVMVVHDSDIPGVSKAFSGAVLLEFVEGLIIKIELFYDASPFQKKENNPY